MQQNRDSITSLITTETGPISGIRVSGPDSLNILKKIFSLKYRITKFLPRKMYFGNFKVQNRIIDEGTAVFFKSPKSYTGEDCFEIFFHGNPIISRLLISEIVRLGARIAEPGEFSRRAFFNGKIDLLQAEAISDMYKVQSKKALNLVINNLKGKFSKEINKLKNALLDIIAGIEAYLDFPEDELECGNRDKIISDINNLEKLIRKILKNRDIGKNIFNGYKVSIFGVVNSGKSSLINAILNEDKAIITNIPGTTRDIVEGQYQINGVNYLFYDMAGLRKTENQIEKMGIRKAIKNAKNSDLILHVIDLNEVKEDFNKKISKKLKKYKTITVLNKQDLFDNEEINKLEHSYENPQIISAKTGYGINELKSKIYELTVGKSKISNELFLMNERQISHLNLTLKSLKLSREAVDEGFTYDCITVDLYDALNYLREIIGEISTEDILDRLFSTFCIGK